MKSVVVLLAAAVLASLFTVTQVQSAQAGGSCTGWGSRKDEPNKIRVLDTRTNIRHVVDFKKYVRQVMASGEWPSRLPYATLVAGAQATKQYAWYYTLKGNYRGGRDRYGRCYDVVNTTNDQLWKPWVWGTKKQQRAVNAVWGLSLWKWNTKFFLTGYRAGTTSRCAADANGWKLYARSAQTCAKKGWSGKRILRKYFSKSAHRWSVSK